MHASPQVKFVENQGQWEEFIEYRAEVPSGKLFLEKDRFTYHFVSIPEEFHHPHHSHHKGHDEEEPLVKSHAFQLIFEGASQDVQFSAGDKASEYHNYYLGNDQSKWATRVPLFGEVTYESLYEGIDLRIYSTEAYLKYDFILAAGANPKEVKMRYEGADKVRLHKGNLHVHTSVNIVRELAPVAYQEIGGERVEIPCMFRLRGNTVGFVFPKGYDDSLPLIIDPTLIFSTYSGSASDNWGFTATYDNDGNAYGGGIEYITAGAPTSGYPTTVGAIQTVFQGGERDVVLSKFNPTGSGLLFSTYVGGVANDQPHSMVVNDNNELFVFGMTTSSNFPVQTNGADISYNGGDGDIFVLHFNAAGDNLIGSTYIGGVGQDGLNGSPDAATYDALKFNYGDEARGEILLDAQGNCYVVSSTTGDFPITSGVFQPNYGGGGRDGCIVKLTPDLSTILWSSYIGGNGLDASYGIRLDDQNNIYVTGGTTSTNLPTSSTAAFGSYQGGSTDAYILKLNSSASTLLGLTYLGTGSYDQSYFIDLDDDFDVYVTGQTLSNNYPVVGSVYTNTNSHQFVTKLRNDLSGIIYSTVFGEAFASDIDISPTAFLIDQCERVYVAGWGGDVNDLNPPSSAGGTTAGMDITSDGLQLSTDGSDFYLVVMEKDAQSLLYGSFFGAGGGVSEHVDGGTSRFDKDGVVYHAVCAGCGGSSAFPTTGGSWSQSNNSANCNLAVFKIEFELSGVEADFTPVDENSTPVATIQACPPFNVFFTNGSNGGNSATYFWDFGENGNTSTLFEPTYLYTTPGIYTVELIIEDSLSCNLRDTVYRTIEILTPPVAVVSGDTLICDGDTATLAASGGVSYLWSPSIGLSSPTAQNPLASPTSTITYQVVVTDANGCEDSTEVEVELDGSPPITISSDTLLCEGGSVQLGVTGAVSFNWSPTNTVSNPTIADPIVSPDTTTVYVFEGTNPNTCPVSDSVRVEIFEVLVSRDTSMCIGDSVRLEAFNGVNFSWIPTTGLSDPMAAKPLASPPSTTSYEVTSVSVEGCVSKKDILLTVFEQPTAFAGENDTICENGSIELEASGGVSYLWSPANVFNNETLQAPTATLTGTSILTVVVTDGNGCKDTSDLEIFVYGNPVVSATPEGDRICEGDTVELLAAGAITYVWLPSMGLSDSTSANPIAIPEITTEYIVIGTDNNGCVDSASSYIEVVQRPVTVVDGINEICLGGSIILTATGGSSYVWNTGDSIPSIEVIPTEPTTYVVTAYEGNCEGTPDSITVDVFFDYPEASFIATPDTGFAPVTVAFENTSTGASSYEWTFGLGFSSSEEENPTFTYGSAGEWVVRLIAYSAQNCPDTAWAVILTENIHLFVPSGFTPNGDSHNDFFTAKHYGIRELNVQIFSRWGKLIYEADDLGFQWRGDYKDRPVPEGVYTYVIRAVGENGRAYIRKGTVTLVR